jgi:hypothetical protein
MIGRLLKNDYKKLLKKTLPKKSPKKIFSKINQKFIEKKTYILSKKGMSKKILQKSLKTKKTNHI